MIYAVSLSIYIATDGEGLYISAMEVGRSCLDCGSTDLVHDYAAGDLICTQCGLVAEGHIICEDEGWVDPHATRCAPMFDNGETHTQIAAPTVAVGKAPTTLQRAHRMQSSGMTPAERAVVMDIEKYSRGLHLNATIVATAKQLYADFRKQRSGKRDKALVACCLFHACRLQKLQGVTRSKPEVFNSCGVSESAFTKIDKVFRKALTNSNESYVQDLYSTVDPGDLVLRHVDYLCIDRDQARQVKSITLKLSAMVDAVKGLTGRTPESMSCALISIACKRTGVKLSRHEICEQLALVKLNTLNTVLKELEGHGIS